MSFYVFRYLTPYMYRLAILNYNEFMNDYRPLNDLKIHADHVHINQLQPLVNSITTFGFNSALRVWRGYVVAGSHCYRALCVMQERGDSVPSGCGIRMAEDGVWEVACIDVSHLTEKEAKAFLLADNQLGRTGHDDPQALQKLLAELPVDLVNAAGYGAADLADIIGEGGDVEASDDLLPEVEPVVKPGFVPITYWPSSNEWGIPDLLPELQGEAILPPQIAKWGSMARTSVLEDGLYHFYVEDYKFSALLDDPTAVVNSRCKAVIEPNFSSRPNMPRAEVLYLSIYKKRWLSRYFQSQDIRVYVDLNIEREYFDLALYGVPRTWHSFANRAYTNDLSHLEDAYRLVVQYTQNNGIIYVVYGGGVSTQQLCKERGWVWIPEEADVVRGRYTEALNGARNGAKEEASR